MLLYAGKAVVAFARLRASHFEVSRLLPAVSSEPDVAAARRALERKLLPHPRHQLGPRNPGGGGKDTIVGYECDGCEFEMRDGLPRPTHRDGTPESFTILATCPARWDAAPHHHPAVSNSASFLRASEPFSLE